MRYLFRALYRDLCDSCLLRNVARKLYEHITQLKVFNIGVSRRPIQYFYVKVFTSFSGYISEYTACRAN